MLMMAPICCSTVMTKTFSSLPTNRAQPLFAGRIPRIWTGNTSFFMQALYLRMERKTSHRRFFERVVEAICEGADGFSCAAVGDGCAGRSVIHIEITPRKQAMKNG